MKYLVSLVIGFGGVQPGRVPWAHELKTITAGKLLYRKVMEVGWPVAKLVTQAGHPVTLTKCGFWARIAIKPLG